MESYHKIGVRLYYYILKLHRTKLPPHLRPLGDKYVKEEFHLHLKKADEEQYKQFLEAWIDYYRTMLQTTDIKKLGRDIDPVTWSFFSNEQKDALNKLKDHTFSKK